MARLAAASRGAHEGGPPGGARMRTAANGLLRRVSPLDASAAGGLVRVLPRSVNDAFEPLSARRRAMRIGCHAGGIR